MEFILWRWEGRISSDLNHSRKTRKDVGMKTDNVSVSKAASFQAILQAGGGGHCAMR
ncbi:uncharacterized protein BT62DRAFT_933671 [Guyanagaster necrorhizus]|uniref:Uncharacterized protein n=1 Tax=Guyanagaster necrorhizus TaxID=856835 RepID=A0A9P8AR92_9AGAR|nr:uncharacterized protein BT62DRAFT_933671 [Guyanagaster necrorhizus MCA 3950]KAG7444636.1 hypothetical protein BT62DRAFT_933671 [Guyanagaster necrorhizus MCA 3950]